MSATSDIATQQNRTTSAAQGKKNGLLGALKDPKKAIMDSVMNRVMSSMDIPSPEEMQADMKKNMPATGPQAEAVERENISAEILKSDEASGAIPDPNGSIKEEDHTLDAPSGNDALSNSEKKFQTPPSTDGVDTATAIPTTEGVDESGEVPDPNGPTLNDPELKEPALATPREERPSLDEPTDSDARPDAIATPHQDEPNLDKPDQKEPEKPKEMSNPTLKEKPTKNDPRLKPEMELPTEGDLRK